MTIYNHAKRIQAGNILREVVFGMEDGMVSTLGSLTGIAIGSQSKDAVILAGFVIIAVESISMGIGSYISNKTKQSADRRRIVEEKIEMRDYPDEETEELRMMFIRDGWSEKTAAKMIKEAAGNDKLMLKEMAYRELQIFPDDSLNPIVGGFYMLISYILGGFVPLVSYIFLPISSASVLSIGVTLVGLFVLGAITTKYTGEKWYRSGLRILVVGGIAMFVGLMVGEFFSLSN